MTLLRWRGANTLVSPRWHTGQLQGHCPMCCGHGGGSAFGRHRGTQAAPLCPCPLPVGWLDPQPLQVPLPSGIVPTRGPWALWEQRGHPGRDVLGRQQRGAVWPQAHLFFGWEGSVSSAAAAGACDSRRHRRVGRWRQDERWARAVTSLRSLGWGAPQDPASCLSRARSSSFPRVPADGAAPHIPLCSDFRDLFRDFFQHWVGSSR